MRFPFRTGAGLAVLLLLAWPGRAVAGGSFYEDFSSSTLDPAWQVVSYDGPRVYGFTEPANHYSLTDNPGHLRYSVDPMTHFDGYLNGYQTTYSVHSCCDHDPGLELHRMLSGDHWMLEAKATSYLPYTNGRYFGLRVYFGDGGDGTTTVRIGRGRDLDQNFVYFYLQHANGPTWPDNVTLLETPYIDYNPVEPPETFYYRVERAGGVLTVRHSEDRLTWTTDFTHDMGNQLDGLAQRVVLTGISWFDPGASYTDWDYVSFASPAPEATLVGGAGDQAGLATAIRGGDLYAVGSLALKYDDLPPASAPTWLEPLPDPNTYLTGLALPGSTVFPVGSAVPPACGAVDGVGGTESKTMRARYDTDGNLLDCASTNFFTYTGGEGKEAALAVVESGASYVYATGGAENCGFGYNVLYLVKYDEAGNRLNAVSEPGVSFDNFNCLGFSLGRGLASKGGYIYVAGFSGLEGLGEDGGVGTGLARPVLMKYDSGLVRKWKARSMDSPGLFNAVAAVGTALYAVGNTYVVAGPSSDPNPLAGSRDYLIEKYNTSGHRVWRVTSGGADDDVLTGVVGIGSRVFAVGHTRSSGAGGADAVVLEIDPATGSTLSTTLFGGAEDDFLNGAATDGSDVYGVGESRSFATADGNSVGENDLLILRQPIGPFVSIGDVTLSEGDTGTAVASFTVSLSEPRNQAVTVHYATANGTAKQPTDYVKKSGTLTFSAGQTAKVVEVTINGDTLPEPDETVLVNLTSPVGARIIDAQGVGTILNDDPVPTLSIGDVSLAEGQSGSTVFEFTVSLSNPIPAPVSVKYATVAGTALSSDYTTRSGTLTIPAGLTSGVVSVSVKGDTTFEPDETFSVNLTNPTSATIADASALATIQNDDLLPAISIGDRTVTEGNSGTVYAVFSVALSNASSQPVTVHYSTADAPGGAQAPGDYASKSGNLIFAAGTTSKTITVSVKGDTGVELDETFFVELSGETNASIADAQGTGTIVNDD